MRIYGYSLGVLVLSLACRSAGTPAAHGVTPEDASTGVLDAVLEVGELELFIRCQGVGTPVVVFESGLGGGAALWQSVQADVALQTRACAYDRAGRGRSSAAQYPHPLQQMAEELHDLLHVAGQVAPFVLVGHSMGAGPVRWFANQHAEQVAGMVLIDPATAPAIEAALADAPVDTLAEYDRNLRAVEGIDRDSYLNGFARLRESGQTLGERPLMVLIAGQPEATLEARQALRAETEGLSSDVVRVVAAKSGHDVAIDEPTLVSRSVLSVVAAVRGSQPVKSVWASQIRDSADE